MAKGGWTYTSFVMSPHANTTALWEADWDGISDAIVNLGLGWAVDVGNTRYYTSNPSTEGAWYRTWLHSSGARLAFCVNNTDYNVSGGRFMNWTNNVSSVDLNSYSSQQKTAFAYSPPGNSGWGVGVQPDDPGFVTNSDFGFGVVGYDSTSQTTDYDTIWDGTGGMFTFHFIGKDDDLFILMENRSDLSRDFDYFWGFGTLLDTLAHPTEETDSNISHEAFVGALNGMGGLAHADSPQSWFRTPGIDGPRGTTAPVKRSTHGIGLTWLSTGLSTTVHSYIETGEDPWVTPYVYIADGSISTVGVIAGNGMKATLNPDIIRVVQGWGMTQRQTFDGGNFLYLGGNVGIGWDPGNGPMT